MVKAFDVDHLAEYVDLFNNLLDDVEIVEDVEQEKEESGDECEEKPDQTLEDEEFDDENNENIIEVREKVVELTTVLEQLYKFTNMIQGDGVTISKLLPSLKTVIRNVNLRALHEESMRSNKNLKAKDFHFDRFSQAIIEGINDRFDYVFKEDIYTLASILDPNYGTSWIPVEERKYWLDKFQVISVEMGENESVSTLVDRMQQQKISPLCGWTIDFDKNAEVFDSNFKYDILIQTFLDCQKQSRISAKELISQKKKDNVFIWIRFFSGNKMKQSFPN